MGEPNTDDLIVFDPLSAAFAEAPFDVLAAMLRRGKPFVHRKTIKRLVSVFGYSECEAVLQDHELWSSNRGEEVRRAGLGDAMILLFDDPPVHTARRNVAKRHFMPRSLSELEPAIQARIASLLARHAGDEIDFVAAIAAPLTISTIGLLLSIEDREIPLVRSWTEQLARIDGISNFLQEPDDWMEQSASAVLEEMAVFFAAKIKGRSAPGGDLLGALLSSELSREEAVSMAKFIVHAGNETTTNLLSQLVVMLISHPDQYDRLKSDPSLISGAVDETLRLRGSFRETERVATRDCSFAGVDFRKGDTIVTWLASANRDPAVFEEPDRFDIGRYPIRHLSFARGIHTCLGNLLAKSEAAAFLTALMEHDARLELVGEDAVTWSQNPLMNGLTRLNVRIGLGRPI